jgi:hypothetical protein
MSMASRILFPRTGFTTDHLVETYEQLAPVLLPHLSHRPLTLKRFPDDIHREAFWEKDAPSFTPAFVQRFPVPRKHEEGVINYMSLADLKSLKWAAGAARFVLFTRSPTKASACTLPAEASVAMAAVPRAVTSWTFTSVATRSASSQQRVIWVRWFHRLTFARDQVGGQIKHPRRQSRPRGVWPSQLWQRALSRKACMKRRPMRYEDVGVRRNGGVEMFAFVLIWDAEWYIAKSSHRRTPDDEPFDRHTFVDQQCGAGPSDRLGA